MVPSRSPVGDAISIGLIIDKINCLPVPTTSPCYTAPRRPPASTLAAGKQTPTQILHLPESIWTVTYLTDVSQESFQQHRPSPISTPKLAHPKPSKPVKRWNFRKANWDHYSNLTNKLAKSIPPPESHNIDQAYQCFCKVISTAAEKCIPRRQSNHMPCWDAEGEDLYQHFLQSPEGPHSYRAVAAQLTRLDGKWRNRWSGTIRNIDFLHSSRLAWNTIKSMTGRSRQSPRQCPVSADAIASQLVKNGKYEGVNRRSSRFVLQEVSDLWKAD